MRSRMLACMRVATPEKKESQLTKKKERKKGEQGR